jgi:DNA-binding HxlR family transcriptional regulator
VGKFNGYGQICPLAKASEVLCERWTPLIVRELAFGSSRFAELQRGLPMISPSTLSQRLRQLEDEGVIRKRRRAAGAQKPRSGESYELTASGQEFAPILMDLSAWGKRWAMTKLRREDLEPSYMMWLAHRLVRTDGFRQARTVIAYEFQDAPVAKRRWWLVIERGEVELCFKPPGFAVDLTVSLRLRAMADLLLGRLSAAQAMRSEAVRLAGSRELSRAFPRWCPRSDS